MQLTPSHLAALAQAIQPQPSGADFSAMRESGMIEPRYNAGQLAGWQLTERGQAWINAALALPLPERRWIVRGALETGATSADHGWQGVRVPNDDAPPVREIKPISGDTRQKGRLENE